MITPVTLHRAIAEELWRERKAAGLSQRQLAERIPGCSKWDIANHETARRSLTLARFVDVCRALNTQPGTLLDRAIDAAEGCNRE